MISEALWSDVTTWATGALVSTLKGKKKKKKAGCTNTNSMGTA